MKTILLVMILLVSAPAMGADFAPALKYTLDHEGKYQNHYADSGNWTGGKVGVGKRVGTKYGLAGSVYYEYFAARGKTMEGISLSDVGPIYERDYWRPLGLHKVASQAIAEELFDGAVNMGVPTQARILQMAINVTDRSGKPPLKVDGAVGPATLMRMASVDRVELYCHLIGLRYGRYSFIVANDPSKKAHFRTWVSRMRTNVERVVMERRRK